MRKELKNKLDHEAKRDKKKKYLVSILVGAGFLLFIVVFLPLFPKTVTNTKGVAVKLSAKQTEAGSIPIMIVKLEGSTTIKATMPRELEFVEGATVNILKKKSLIGTYSYEVVGYGKPDT